VKRSNRTSTPGPRPAARSRHGIVLLEVVLALAAFFTVGGLIIASLDAAVGAAEEVRNDARAADLAVTLLSQIHVGLLEPQNTGPEYCDEPLEDWTWEIVAETVSADPTAPDMLRLEVVVRNTERGRVHRLAELVPAGRGIGAEEAW
jgi:hypothetical protein